MKELLDRFFKSWKSTLVAIIIGICTYMVYKKQMTAEEFVTVIGSVGVLYGVLKKDNDL